MRPPILQKLDFIHSKMELFLDLIKKIFLLSYKTFYKDFHKWNGLWSKKWFLVGKRLKWDIIINLIGDRCNGFLGIVHCESILEKYDGLIMVDINKKQNVKKLSHLKNLIQKSIY